MTTSRPEGAKGRMADDLVERLEVNEGQAIYLHAVDCPSFCDYACNGKQGGKQGNALLDAVYNLLTLTLDAEAQLQTLRGECESLKETNRLLKGQLDADDTRLYDAYTETKESFQAAGRTVAALVEEKAALEDRWRKHQDLCVEAENRSTRERHMLEEKVAALEARERALGVHLKRMIAWHEWRDRCDRDDKRLPAGAILSLDNEMTEARDALAPRPRHEGTHA